MHKPLTKLVFMLFDPLSILEFMHFDLVFEGGKRELELGFSFRIHTR